MTDAAFRNSPPLLALGRATLTYGDRTLFRNADMEVMSGDRICLVGRNGTGKSTLMRVLAGELDIDSGARFVQPGLRVGYLPQQPAIPDAVTVRAHVLAAPPVPGRDRPRDHDVDAILHQLGLDGARMTDSLSGGEFRRTAIARLLVIQPDILLLDEPTNHLDLPTITWLEDTLRRFQGGTLIVSHDRVFLTALSNRTYWLERAVLRRRNAGFEGFADWSEAVLADAETHARKRDRKIVEETRWLREGLTARRKRNMGRVRVLQAMRDARTTETRRQGNVRFTLAETARSGDLVLEARDISKRFAGSNGCETVIAERFSTIIRRRDRVGIIGPNGAGKTTLLRMLIGNDSPDSGRVRVGNGVETVYFDQSRELLNPDATLRATLCPNGGDTVEVGGRTRHVVAYLRDFLFEDRQANSPVRSLSGGERNRLLLARLFSQPHNLVALDEPTNDLDIETLELLEDILAAYDGTILLVSHDREFLDRIVTSTIAIEGNGIIDEYPGGYSDYRKQRPQNAGRVEDKSAGSSAAAPRRQRPQTKLGYKDQRELDDLPARIAELESRIGRLRHVLSDPDLYQRDRVAFDDATRQLSEIEAALAAAEERWLELEDRNAALAVAQPA